MKNGELIEAGVDYLTVTFNEEKCGKKAAKIAEEIIEQERSRGNEVKPWSFMGFIGYRCGSIQAGLSGNTLLVRLSGGLAHEHWRPLAELSTNCSRLDLQVTVRCEEPAQAVVSDQYERIAAARAEGRHRATVSVWRGSDGAATVYCGKRASNVFARIYSKEAESKSEAYRGCVRWEVELKKRAARIVLAELIQAGGQEAFSLARCSGMFSAYGGNVPVVQDQTHTTRVPRSRSDVTRRLTWLEADVRGCVASLISHGQLERVLAALDLSQHVILRSRKRAPTKRRTAKKGETKCQTSE